METIESLITHLEELDKQLAPALMSPDLQDGKLVKEVLFTRLEIRRFIQRHSHVAEGTPLADRMSGLRSAVYNIDRLNERYGRSVACPACSMTDVAVIKKVPVQKDITFDLHNNPRLKLMVHDPAPAAGKFVCNTCFNRFNPPLPSHVVKLCEMLFAYYN